MAPFQRIVFSKDLLFGSKDLLLFAKDFFRRIGWFSKGLLFFQKIGFHRICFFVQRIGGERGVRSLAVRGPEEASLGAWVVERNVVP